MDSWSIVVAMTMDDRKSAIWRLQPLKPDEFQILLALADEACHGYGIVKAVASATDGLIRLQPSPLYRKLRRMMELGVVALSDKRPAPDLDDERRRYYRLTDSGHALLVAEARRLVTLGASPRVRALAEADGVSGDG